MEIKSYNVRGMSCGGCAASVTRAIQAADGTAQVEVDLGRAMVVVKGTMSEDDVQNAVERAGFEYHGVVDSPS